ncbi:hypothetical protein MCOR25_004731 [Pyricularia grisea]|nr:hypothetical protein MCOR25_004731 [Pyricularia grisea]
MGRLVGRHRRRLAPPFIHAVALNPQIAEIVANFQVTPDRFKLARTPAVVKVTSDITSRLVAGAGLSGVDPRNHATNVDSDYDNDNDSESEITDEDSDSEDSGDDEILGKYDEKVVEFLNTLPPVIERKHNSTPIEKVSALQEGIEPFQHQKVAAAFALDTLSDDNLFKGCLIADPPGLGKTLSSLMAASESRRPGDGPCVVVAPRSCCDQWMREGNRFFGDNLKMIMVTGEPISPMELFKYDVVVTAYSTLVAETQRCKKYINAIKKIQRTTWREGSQETRHVLTF